MNGKKFSITILFTALSIVIFFSSQAKASEINSENIIKNINSIRTENSLPELRVDTKLQSAAYSKSVDMITKNYFDHYAFGLTPWMFINNQGYEYSKAGENLAMGFQSSEGVVYAWMNSPLHKKNLLNNNFEDIGVGVVRGSYTENGKAINTTIITQISATPKTRAQLIIEKIVKTLSKF